jgi:dihydropyrimidine dehydrogenase (NAD+) subunit PreA
MRALLCGLRGYQPSGDFHEADRVFEVIDAECVACNLCVNVCPVENCITMERMPAGSVDPRTGRVVSG